MSIHMRLAAVLITWHGVFGVGPLAAQQSNSTAATSNMDGTDHATAVVPPGIEERKTWLVRDPQTGRIYQQELVSVTVPTTQWEVKPVASTIYEPRNVTKSVPSTQVVYTPSTQYVMQPRLRGWWNPLRQPVQAYEFVPITSWQPQTQAVQSQVSTIEWVPKQQIVYVPQSVQRLQTQQQIVSREIPPTAAAALAGTAAAIPPSGLAGQPKPLINIPILSQQRILPWPENPANSGYAATPSTTMRGVVSNGLRPVASAISPGYSAPLQPTNNPSNVASRDAFQTGMSPTVLR
jgi:hypothetical protein